MAKDHGPMIKNDDQYEALRKEGMSKEKAARITNASWSEGQSTIARRGGKAENYEDRTVDELRDRAREVGIEGRSNLDKEGLIKALREH